jgi:hypothetical protein
MNVYRSSTNGCEVQSSEAESLHDEGHNCSHPINKTFRADVIRSPDPSRGTRFSSLLVGNPEVMVFDSSGYRAPYGERLTDSHSIVLFHSPYPRSDRNIVLRFPQAGLLIVSD